MASATHIFFHCSLSTQTWSSAGIQELIMNFLQLNFSLWMQNLILSHSYQIIELATTICNLLWFHRNKHKHDLSHNVLDPYSIVAAAFSLLHDYYFANSWPERSAPKLVKHPLVTRSLHGPQIYVDGALCYEQNHAGVGVVIFYDENGFFHIIAKLFANVDNPEMVEFLALHEAFSSLIN